MNYFRQVPVVLLFLCASCGSEKAIEPGSIKFSWRLGGKTCEDLGVEQVRASLWDKNQNQVPNQLLTYACKAYTGTLDEVPPGTYTLLLEGLTGEGHAYYEGKRDGVVVKEATETIVSPAINLALKKSQVILRWDFPSGTGHCSGNKVEEIEVLVSDSKASTIHEQTYPCVLAPDKYPEGGITLADLSANEEFTFLLYGLNSSHQRTYYARKDIKTIPGETTDLTVTLQPCAGPDLCP